MSTIVEKIVEESRRGRGEREGLVLVISGRFARLYSGDTKIGEEEVDNFDKYWKGILLNEELDIGDPPLRHYVRSEDETAVVLMEGKTPVPPELLGKILEENNVREVESIVRILHPNLVPPLEKVQRREEEPMTILTTTPALFAPPLHARLEEDEDNVKFEGSSIPIVPEVTISIKDLSLLSSVVENAIQDGFEIVERGKTTTLAKEIKYGLITVKIDHEESKLKIRYEDHFLLRQSDVIKTVLSTLLKGLTD
jgi:hypothetical protein